MGLKKKGTGKVKGNDKEQKSDRKYEGEMKRIGVKETGEGNWKIKVNMKGRRKRMGRRVGADDYPHSSHLPGKIQCTLRLGPPVGCSCII